MTRSYRNTNLCSDTCFISMDPMQVFCEQGLMKHDLVHASGTKLKAKHVHVIDVFCSSYRSGSQAAQVTFDECCACLMSPTFIFTAVFGFRVHSSDHIFVPISNFLNFTNSYFHGRL